MIKVSSFCVRVKVVALVNIYRVPNPDKEHCQLPQMFSVQISGVVHFLIPNLVRKPPEMGEPSSNLSLTGSNRGGHLNLEQKCKWFTC